MYVVTIDKILERRNKTRYWLAKETEIYYPSLIKLCNNQTSSISFNTIERICFALECTPNDIIQLIR